MIMFGWNYGYFLLQYILTSDDLNTAAFLLTLCMTSDLWLKMSQSLRSLSVRFHHLTVMFRENNENTLNLHRCHLKQVGNTQNCSHHIFTTIKACITISFLMNVFFLHMNTYCFFCYIVYKRSCI